MDSSTQMCLDEQMLNDVLTAAFDYYEICASAQKEHTRRNTGGLSLPLFDVNRFPARFNAFPHNTGGNIPGTSDMGLLTHDIGDMSLNSDTEGTDLTRLFPGPLSAPRSLEPEEAPRTPIRVKPRSYKLPDGDSAEQSWARTMVNESFLVGISNTQGNGLDMRNMACRPKTREGLFSLIEEAFDEYYGQQMVICVTEVVAVWGYKAAEAGTSYTVVCDENLAEILNMVINGSPATHLEFDCELFRFGD